MTDTNEIMKKCQIGFGSYPKALQHANNLLAECYGTIGKLEAENAKLNTVAADLFKSRLAIIEHNEELKAENAELKAALERSRGAQRAASHRHSTIG
jgi:regulator of replication initiation timing